jgi:hypothetical protein
MGKAPAEVENPANCIEQGREPLNNGENALHPLRLVLAEDESDRTGRVGEV